MDEYTTRQLLEELKRRGTEWPDATIGRALRDYSDQMLGTLSRACLDHANVKVQPRWADLVSPWPERGDHGMG